MIAKGRIYRGHWVHVRYGKADATEVVISVRRRYGSAVRRNRVRRRIRAIFREMVPDRNPDGTLMLISVGDRSTSAGFRALRKDLGAAFRALGLR